MQNKTKTLPHPWPITALILALIAVCGLIGYVNPAFAQQPPIQTPIISTAFSKWERSLKVLWHYTQDGYEIKSTLFQTSDLGTAHVIYLQKGKMVARCAETKQVALIQVVCEELGPPPTVP